MQHVDTTPTLARYMLGKTLKRLRTAAGINTKTAAETCHVVTPTITRWEAATSTPKPLAVAALGNLYGASDADIEKMCSWATKAQRRGLFEHADVPPDARMLFEAEHVAYAIRCVELENVPGLLQVPEYLMELQAALPQYFDPSTLEQIREVRERRQAAQAARSEPPITQYVIGVAAMTYLAQMPIEVREAQIERLREAVADGIDIRVVTRPHAAMSGSFTLVQISPGYPPFAYTETVAGSQYLEDSNVVSRFEQTFQSAQETAITLEEYLT